MLGRMESALAGLVTLLFSVVLIAGVSVSVTRGAATGQLPRGGGAGIRTRRTQASDDAWRAAHTAALPLVNRLGWVATGAVAAALIAQTLFGGMWGMAAAGPEWRSKSACSWWLPGGPTGRPAPLRAPSRRTSSEAPPPRLL